MNKYILGIDGMMCGACEAHVQNEIRKKLNVKSVKASRLKNQAIIITDIDVSEEKFHEILDPTGYRITSFNEVEATKRLFGWK